MADNNLSREQLSELLQKVPDRTSPDGLVEQILETVRASDKHYCRPEKRNFFSLPLWETLWPRQFVALACSVFLAFWLGLYVGGKKDNAIIQSAILQLPGYVYQNAQAGFLVGRGLLAAGKGNEALAVLQNASQLSPENPEYLFWLGTAHWRMGNTEMEQLSYRKAVQVDPDYLPALVNLGHNLLEQKKPEEALQTYNRVLAIAPEHQVALYNRALASRMAGDTDQAIIAWKEYLSLYRSGKWAYRAVHHLNEQGDFSYREYPIGVRQIIVNQDVLLGPLTVEKKREVDYLAGIFRQAPVSDINLTFFCAGDAEKARSRAVILKSLLSESLQDHNKRIQISWFAEPEVVRTAVGMKNLENGILISGQLQLSQIQGESI